jgi:integrase
MKPTKLREGIVSKLMVPAGKRDAFLFDTELRGFGIRKQSTGRASYFVKYSIDGKRTHVRLGPVVGSKLSDMREKAATILTGAMAGHDIAAERKARARKPTALLLGDLIERYLADREGKRRLRYVAELTRQLRRDWKPLHGMAAREITSEDVAPILERIATDIGDTTADRAKAALSACYSWALEPERRLVSDTPVKHFKARATSSRDRFLSEVELIAVWKACLDDDHGRIVRLLILT